MANSREELERIMKESLKLSFNLEDGAAAALAEEIVKSMAEIVGGSHLYIPSKGRAARIERNAKIKREFNGKNTDELAVKYGLSRRQIQRITTPISAIRRRAFRRMEALKSFDDFLASLSDPGHTDSKKVD